MALAEVSFCVGPAGGIRTRTWHDNWSIRRVLIEEALAVVEVIDGREGDHAG